MIRASLFALALAAATPAFAQTAPSLIDGAALVGSAPAPETVRAAADHLAMHPHVSAERLAQAQADQPFDPWSALAPVMGADFTEARLPRTARVFADVIDQLGPAIGSAKEAAARARPFLADPDVLQCDQPSAELAASGSYPSGHAAGGWAWALVVAELVPARADALLQRGRDFGDSRVICGFHFPSDIDAGRVLAAGVVAGLHGDARFRRDMDAARRELARAYRD